VRSPLVNTVASEKERKNNKRGGEIFQLSSTRRGGKEERPALGAETPEGEKKSGDNTREKVNKGPKEGSLPLLGGRLRQESA